MRVPQLKEFTSVFHTASVHNSQSQRGGAFPSHLSGLLEYEPRGDSAHTHTSQRKSGEGFVSFVQHLLTIPDRTESENSRQRTCKLPFRCFPRKSSLECDLDMIVRWHHFAKYLRYSHCTRIVVAPRLYSTTTARQRPTSDIDKRNLADWN